MTIGYHRLIPTSNLDCRYCVEYGTIDKQVNQDAGTWYVASDLVNEFFPRIRKGGQKQFIFLWGEHQYSFTVLPQVYMNSSAFCHNIVQRDLGRIITLITFC